MKDKQERKSNTQLRRRYLWNML